MDIKPQERDLRKHFEAILGHEIGDMEDAAFDLRVRTALLFEIHLDTISRKISTTGDSIKIRGTCHTFYIAGLTETGEDGKAEFLLTDYLPLSPEIHFHFEHPIIIFGTAQSHDPVFVTIHTSGISNNKVIKNVRVKIYTWQPGGAPAKGKLVKWLCIVPVEND